MREELEDYTPERIGGYSSAEIFNLPNAVHTYATGEVVGGALELTNVLRKKTGTGTLQSITLFDDGANNEAFDILFFSAEPTSDLSDTDPLLLEVADYNKLLGTVSVIADDWVNLGNGAVATVRCISLPVQLDNDDGSLWCFVVARGTPTIAENGLHLRVGLLSD